MVESARKEQIAHFVALTKIRGLGVIEAARLINYFGSAESIFKADRECIMKVLEPKKNLGALAEIIKRFDGFKDIYKEMDRALDIGVSFLLLTDEKYPDALKYIPDPPIFLLVQGEIKKEDSLGIGIVGTRKLDNYGRSICSWISRELASRGVTIVSGLARGIDTESHRSALDCGGRTIAVTGTGPDIVYPSENKALKEKIIKQGAVITEYMPGAEGLTWHFPARNRIIAGLTLGTVVVQAPEKSGALITARLAADYNREVFAVPGNLNNPRSRGCNLLIRDGAKPVILIEDILEEFGLTKVCTSPLDISRLSHNEKIILESIEEQGSLPDMIVQKTGLPSYIISSSLLELELKKIIRRMPGGVYMKSR